MKAVSAILLLTLAASSVAEILDRIAVTVDDIVITERDITNHLRVAAFLNGEPVELTLAARREAAGRLVEQTLVRREMEISRYPIPAATDADSLVSQIRDERFPSDEAFRETLSEYHLDEDDLREGLRLQLTVLRFIDYRFRPGITVTEEEVERYYEDVLAPESRRSGETTGSIDSLRDTIEEILIGQRINEALDEWLEQTLATSRVVYREEAFQ